MSTEVRVGVRARNSLWASFLIMGIASMAWVPRIPEIKENLGLSDGEFGFVFVGSTIGAVLGAQIAGRAIHTFGSRPVINLSSFLLPVGLIAMAYAETALTLFLALMLMGFGYALTDMSVNSQAIVVEKILSKKWMSSFHGMWSLGSFLTTVFGGAISHHTTPKENLIIVAIFSLIAFLPANFTLLSPSVDEHAGDGSEKTDAKIPLFGKKYAILWAIGFGMIAGMIAEGAASDWGGILLKDEIGIDKGWNASAFACFALAMITSRFLGDKALHKFGARNTVRYGGLIGGIGWGASLVIAIPLSADHPFAAMIVADIGFIFAGLGIGPMFPAFILAASRVPGVAPAVAISRVGLIGIAGFFIGPTITGLIAEVTTLAWAMAYPIGMVLVAGFMSRAIKTEAKL